MGWFSFIKTSISAALAEERAMQDIQMILNRKKHKVDRMTIFATCKTAAIFGSEKVTLDVKDVVALLHGTMPRWWEFWRR